MPSKSETNAGDPKGQEIRPSHPDCEGVTQSQSQAKPAVKLLAIDQVSAIFLNHPTAEVSVIQLQRLTGHKYEACRAAVRRLLAEQLILKHGRSVYALLSPDRLRARLNARHASSTAREKLAALEAPTSALQSLSEHWRQWLDRSAIILEHGRLDLQLDRDLVAQLRSHLLGENRVSMPRQGDRSQKVQWRGTNFTLVLTKYGHLQLTFRSLAWFQELWDLLEQARVAKDSAATLFRQLIEQLHTMKLTVEAPLKQKLPPAFRDLEIETKVGPHRILSRIGCKSHFPSEVEISGDFHAVLNFISLFAGTQHFSVLQVVQTTELSRINEQIMLFAKDLNGIAHAINTAVEHLLQPNSNDHSVKNSPEQDQEQQGEDMQWIG